MGLFEYFCKLLLRFLLTFESLLFIFDNKIFYIMLLRGINLSHDTVVNIASGVFGRLFRLRQVILFSLIICLSFGFVNGFCGS